MDEFLMIFLQKFSEKKSEKNVREIPKRKLEGIAGDIFRAIF